MKISKFIFLGTLICLNLSQLFGQTEGSSLIKPYGIGLHIEQFKIGDVDEMNTAPANKIIFTFSPSNSFRLEPEFGFRVGNNKTTQLKNSGFYFGCGAFSMIQRNKLNIYGGLRTEYAIIKWDDPYSYSGSKTSNKTNRLAFGPAIGCEYYLGENLAFGGEFVLKYATLKNTKDPKPTSSDDEESNYLSTDTGLFIRFYF